MFPLGPEILVQHLPESGIFLTVGRPGEKSVILTDFRTVSRIDQHIPLSALVIRKEAVLQRAFPNCFAKLFCLFPQTLVPIQRRHGKQHPHIEHIGGEIHILHHILVIGSGPFHENPAVKPFQKPIFIFKAIKICCQPINLLPRTFNQLPVFASVQILLQLQHKPHGPVGDKHPVRMIRRIAHGKHTPRQMLEILRQEEIFQESLLQYRLSGKDILHSGGKEAVTEPPCPLSGRTVRKNVHRIGQIGFLCRLINPAKDLVLGQSDTVGRPRMPVLYHIHIFHHSAALYHNLYILHGIRCKCHGSMASGIQPVPETVHGRHPHTVKLPILQYLIE